MSLNFETIGPRKSVFLTDTIDEALGVITSPSPSSDGANPHKGRWMALPSLPSSCICGGPVIIVDSYGVRNIFCTRSFETVGEILPTVTDPKDIPKEDHKYIVCKVCGKKKSAPRDSNVTVCKYCRDQAIPRKKGVRHGKS